MTALLPLLKRFWPVLVGLVLLAGLCFFFDQNGAKRVRSEWDAANVKQQEEIAKLVEEAQANANKKAAEAEREAQKQKQINEAVNRRLKDEIKNAAYRCRIPVDGLRLYNEFQAD